MPERRHGSLSLLFAVGAVAAVAIASDFRFVETRLAATTFEAVGLGATEYLGRDQLFAENLGVPVRFTVTQQCGVMLLIAPLLATAAVVVRSSSVRPFKALRAVVAAAVTLIVANQARLALIGWTIKLIGFEQGFPLGHLVLGTVLSIVAVIASVVMFARMVGSSKVALPARSAT